MSTNLMRGTNRKFACYATCRTFIHEMTRKAFVGCRILTELVIARRREPKNFAVSIPVREFFITARCGRPNSWSKSGIILMLGIGRKKSLGMALGLATTLFDYGPLKEIPPFSGSHPAVMLERIKQMDRQADLYEKIPPGHRPARHKHARLKYRLLSWLENTFFSGRHLFGSKHFFLHRD
jgi:hypothetical protein